jgi:hypothetical protein
MTVHQPRHGNVTRPAAAIVGFRRGRDAGVTPRLHSAWLCRIVTFGCCWSTKTR